MAITYGVSLDYSAMQGPCPNGFHVASVNEWNALNSICTSLGVQSRSYSENFFDTLLMPDPGFLYPQTGKRYYGGNSSYGQHFWTCDPVPGGYYVYTVNGTEHRVSNNLSRNGGYNIRPFKDIPVVPDGTASWVALYTGTGNAGIFHNSSLGLISSSSNGTDRMTITDKNLGATTVWHDGDTKSESNCGYFYARGNNYGFPYNGATTTTSTRLDNANGYGPGNYYSSSTFVKTEGNPYDWTATPNDNLRGGVTGIIQRPLPINNITLGNRQVTEITLGSIRVRPKIEDFWYSDNNFQEFQNLVNDIGSVQFVDSGKRYRFNNPCYLGNRTIMDVNGTTLSIIDADTLTVKSSISSSINGRMRYFGENRVLTRDGIIDFNGNVITSFGTTYTSIVPGKKGVVRANNGTTIYKGVVEGDNITFTNIGTAACGNAISYGKLGVYMGYSGESSSGRCSYIDPDTNTFTTFSVSDPRSSWCGDYIVSGADGKVYRIAARNNGWGRLQKIGTGDEGLVGTSASTTWGIGRGGRFGKFLGNIVSGNMNTSGGTGIGLCSYNYFIDTSGNLTKVQDNARAYDTNIFGNVGCIDENGLLYPHTDQGGTGVILKTDKTFTNLNWKNPYLWR